MTTSTREDCRDRVCEARQILTDSASIERHAHEDTIPVTPAPVTTTPDTTSTVTHCPANVWHSHRCVSRVSCLCE